MPAITIVLCSLLTLIAAFPGSAQDPGAEQPEVDKSGYHLFNPTPAQHLREMSTDGPAATDSPYTVDAGHFQVEMALATYRYDKDSVDGMTKRLDGWLIAPMTLKVGFLNQADAQLVLEPYHVVHERRNGTRRTRQGFGDTTARLKLNCWGNDSGRTALALMPYVKFPTSEEGLGNDGLEGGLIVPFSVELPAEFYLGLSGSVAKARYTGEPSHHTEYTASVVLSRTLFADFEGYVECLNELNTSDGVGRITTFDTGLLYWLTDDIQLSAGVNIGLTTQAEDWSPFVGVAWRF
jgi:hypothetical protein